MVVAGDAVGFDGAAAGAAVDDGPFTVASDLDRDGFHGGFAVAGSVAGLVVDVA